MGEIKALSVEPALRAPKLLGGPRVPKVRWEEALELPAEVLGSLPLTPRLTLHVGGVPGLVVIDLEPASAPTSEGELRFDAAEWRAIVVAASADRVWPMDFVSFCRRKRDEPAWRIEEETALAGAQPDPRERWSARRVLARIGAELVSIDVAA